METTTEQTTQTPKREDTLIVVTDTMQQVIAAKRVVEGIAKNRENSDELRRYARTCLGPLNALISQALSELS